MVFFYKNKGRLAMATGVFCILILSGMLLTSGLSKGDSANKFEFKLLAYPEKYTMTSSSLPGIRISAQYSGAADKVRYSTTHGSLLTWDTTSGKTNNCGQNVELPYHIPIYWIPVQNDGLPKVNDEISVKVTILNKDSRLAEKQVKINYDGSMYFTVQASPDIVIADNEIDAGKLQAK